MAELVLQALGLPSKPALSSRFTLPAPPLALLAAFSVGSLLLLRALSPALTSSCDHDYPRVPSLDEHEVSDDLPYPPNALPGARDVTTPYGSIRVYEWGPDNGDKILLIHGISTPSIALGDLAHRLVARGCRVMLFDLFGRGYSSGPPPNTHRYDSALYTSQIHLCLQSSPIPWTQSSPFTIIGYSLGGAIAADFTSYFPLLTCGLILVAPGGLIRRTHVSLKSRLLYSTSGLLPERLLESLVAARLWTGPPSARTLEPDGPVTPQDEDAVYASSHHALLEGRPQSSVGAVVDWQIRCHAGFVKAFVSSIRYAPIHGQHERWRILGRNVEEGVGGVRKVWLVLGELDPIIVHGELEDDARACLGEANVGIKVVEGVGHEIAIERAGEIMSVVGEVLGKEGW